MVPLKKVDTNMCVYRFMIWLMYAGHLFKGEIGSPEPIHAVLFEIS